VKGSKGAVAVEAEECSNIGVESKDHVRFDRFKTYFISIVLKKGGNAVDAAIASTLCIGVIHSFATGKK
jgi:gamma-glutamyltranspeptidase/glutathione hydrolase/leukotriene-C4 hydrolase